MRILDKIREGLNLFSEAIRGTEKNFTSGSLNRAIVLLAIPMILEMVMESLFAVVDIYFVGKVSVNAIATVALTESVVMIVYAFSIGLSMAATALVARRTRSPRFQKKLPRPLSQDATAGPAIGPECCRCL